jgi:hypothetical protein
MGRMHLSHNCKSAMHNARPAFDTGRKDTVTAAMLRPNEPILLHCGTV